MFGMAESLLYYHFEEQKMLQFLCHRAKLQRMKEDGVDTVPQLCDPLTVPLYYIRERLALTEFEFNWLMVTLVATVNPEGEYLCQSLFGESFSNQMTLKMCQSLFVDDRSFQVVHLKERIQTMRLFGVTIEQEAGAFYLQMSDYMQQFCLSGKRELQPFAVHYHNVERKSVIAQEEVIRVLGEGTSLVYLLIGKKGMGRKFIIQQWLARTQEAAIVVDGRRWLSNESVNTILLDAILFKQHVVILYADQLQKGLNERWYRFCEDLQHPSFQQKMVFVTEDELDLSMFSSVRSVRMVPYNWENRVALWELYSPLCHKELHRVAQFNVTPKVIINTVQHVRDVTVQNVMTYLQQQTSCRLHEQAERIETTYSLDQLVVTEEQSLKLQLVVQYVQQRYELLHTWGLKRFVAYGHGVTVLLSGPPGTGKTMAAQALAQRLQLELYRVDLAKIMDKYIGETEKKLSDLFEYAEKKPVLLFFDEMDVLFNKRMEVKESNDQYANLKTAYLLQRMESYSGICVLATNFVQNVDEAFLRRIQYVIHFPLPKREERIVFWQHVKTSGIPMDESIDCAFLADFLPLSIGYLKNILLQASTLASLDQQVITYEHFALAISLEYEKIGKIMPIEWLHLLGKEGDYYRIGNSHS